MGDLANRLRNRQRHLRKWARRRAISCYRVYERDIPDVPVIVDWYDGDVVAWLYRRKRDETDAATAAFESEAIADLLDGLEIDESHLFVKRRQRQRGLDQYERLDQRAVTRIVSEGGLRFEVNLSDYLDTGLFLDHRETRQLVRDRAAGTRMLNLFAYTGTFTCYAISGGARETVTVDLSRTYGDWARRNLALNGAGDLAAHRVVQADCLAFLRDPASSRDPFDLIVCDPPTFSNSKRMDGTFAVERDYEELIEACAALLAPGGVIVFSTNARRFRMDEAALPVGLVVRDVSKRTVPEDFRNRRIHQCWLISFGESTRTHPATDTSLP